MQSPPLETLVEEEKPKIPVKLILESEAWQHHQEICEQAQLVIPNMFRSDEEQQRRLEEELRQQRTSSSAEKETFSSPPEQKQTLFQSSPHSSSSDGQRYLSAEAFQAGCQCGAQFSVQGDTVLQTPRTSSYSGGKSSESSYGKGASSETTPYGRSPAQPKKVYSSQ
jgi:hypothetical protein